MAVSNSLGQVSFAPGIEQSRPPGGDPLQRSAAVVWMVWASASVSTLLFSLEPMINRRFPPPWTVERLPGGFKVIDANGQSLAYFYARENDNDANTAGVLTMDEARRMASNFAKLPELLGKESLKPKRGLTMEKFNEIAPTV